MKKTQEKSNSKKLSKTLKKTLSNEINFKTTSSKIINDIEVLKRKLLAKVDKLWEHSGLTKKDFKTDVPILIEIQKFEKYTNKKMEQLIKKHKGKLTFVNHPFKSSPIFTHDFFDQYKKIK